MFGTKFAAASRRRSLLVFFVSSSLELNLVPNRLCIVIWIILALPSPHTTRMKASQPDDVNESTFWWCVIIGGAL